VGDGQPGIENYKQEEVAAAVRLAGSFALLAASALLATSDDGALIEPCWQRCESMCNVSSREIGSTVKTQSWHPVPSREGEVPFTR
jgi:hypothetical protein